MTDQQWILVQLAVSAWIGASCLLRLARDWRLTGPG